MTAALLGLAHPRHPIVHYGDLTRNAHTDQVILRVRTEVADVDRQWQLARSLEQRADV